MKKSYYGIIIILGLAAIALSGCATRAPYLKLDSSLQRDIRSLNGIEYLPLERLCGVYRIDYKWDPIIGIATLQKGPNYIVVRSGSDLILISGDEKKLGVPVILDGGTVFVPVSFARSYLGPLAGRIQVGPVAPEAVPGKFTIRTIVLDAGHGGKDAGAIGKRLGLKEKYMALAIAKRIRNILEDGGIKIIMTRSDDTFISLSKRAEIANRRKADLFVSVHINASRAKYMRGFECYYLADTTDDNARARQAFEQSSLKVGGDASIEHSRQLDRTLWDMALTENRLESAELAGKICDSVEQSLALGNKGVRSARFYVLKFTHMPSVLVEAGYISNRYEESKLQDPRFLDRIADAVSQGILRYKGEYERTEGFTRI